MNILELGITQVAAITVICYLVGITVKAIGGDTASCYIPTIVGTVGGILGVVAMYIMPGFIASDFLTAVAIGIVSGLAATGVDQIGKQLALPSKEDK